MLLPAVYLPATSSGSALLFTLAETSLGTARWAEHSDHLLQPPPAIRRIRLKSLSLARLESWDGSVASQCEVPSPLLPKHDIPHKPDVWCSSAGDCDARLPEARMWLLV